MNEPKSRRELLEAAWDETEEGGGETPGTPPRETPPEGQEPYQREAAAAERQQEAPPEGQTPEGEGTPPAGKEPQKAGKETPAPGTPPAKDGAPPRQQPSGEVAIKAPISWNSAAKAQWGKVPREIQELIQKRELETQQALSKSGQARNFVQEFGRTVMPYAHLIRAQGSTPLAAVDNLMRTAANLMVGNPRQKAELVAEICSNYAVDLRELDTVLAEQQQRPPASHGQGVLPPQFAAALKPIYDFMGQIDQQRQTYQQRLDEKASEDIETFGASKPFFEELREEMADVMEFAASKGRKMTMEQAYVFARRNHPELVDEAPQNGASPEDVRRAASTLARARRTASSVRGAPSGGGGGNLAPPKNRREALERAWDEQVGETR